MDHDQYLLVQAEMRGLILTLSDTDIGGEFALFMARLDDIRRKAAQHELVALHRTACMLETLLPAALERHEARAIARSYIDAMEDALGCENASPAMVEALMASVALRLGGQP